MHTKVEGQPELSCALLILRVIRTALCFQKALMLAKYANQLELITGEEILSLDKVCLD